MQSMIRLVESQLTVAESRNSQQVLERLTQAYEIVNERVR